MSNSDIATEHWLKARFYRQVKALLGLAWPATLSRIGVIFLGTVDTLMIGHYSTQQLAYLNLGSNTIVLLVLVATIGLLIGTLIKTADAYGREDYEGAGQVWNRALPYAFGVGIISLIVCLPGNWIFTNVGLDAEVSYEGGLVMMVLGFGLPSYIIYVHSIFFLEGIEKPKVGMYMMLGANLVNVFLNYILIYGLYGLPEMGAVGSAWASTIGRVLLAIAIVIYMLRATSLEKYKLVFKWNPQWRMWAHQRELGYAASISLGAEVSAFAALSIFAGWMGTLELAAWGIVMNVLTLGFMVAAGMGVAASVRVGISKSREDYSDAGLAGWTAVLLGGIGLTIVALILYFLSVEITQFYTNDTEVIYFTAPLLVFMGVVLFFDGEQAILASSLRGFGESWVPMGLQIVAYWGVLIPLSYYLSIPYGRGAIGLLEAVLVAGLVSCALQGFYFKYLTSGSKLHT